MKTGYLLLALLLAASPLRAQAPASGAIDSAAAHTAAVTAAEVEHGAEAAADHPPFLGTGLEFGTGGQQVSG